MPKQIWVSPRSNGWAVKSSGSPRASKIYSTKSEAIKAGRLNNDP